MAEVTLANVLTSTGSVLTSVVGFFGDVLTFIVSNPLMLMGILLPVACAFVPKGISLIKRATGKKRI